MSSLQCALRELEIFENIYFSCFCIVFVNKTTFVFFPTFAQTFASLRHLRNASQILSLQKRGRFMAKDLSLAAFLFLPILKLEDVLIIMLMVSLGSKFRFGKVKVLKTKKFWTLSKLEMFCRRNIWNDWCFHLVVKNWSHLILAFSYVLRNRLLCCAILNLNWVFSGSYLKLQLSVLWSQIKKGFKTIKKLRPKFKYLPGYGIAVNILVFLFQKFCRKAIRTGLMNFVNID